jgi:hypothetical protein
MFAREIIKWGSYEEQRSAMSSHVKNLPESFSLTTGAIDETPMQPNFQL